MPLVFERSTTPGSSRLRLFSETTKSALLRLLILVLFSGLGLQAYFALRVAWMAVWPPSSTAFERTEMWHIANTEHKLAWKQEWVPYEAISSHLKRAVIASEDGEFTDHLGVDWGAIEAAWERNARAQEAAQKKAELKAAQALKLAQRNAKSKRKANEQGLAAIVPAPQTAAPPVRIVGGSTITQQLAKNLFLSGQRSMLRKAQEFVITFMLEALLSKKRILEIYLNHVEWGQGVFGAHAAATHYYGKPASALSATESARLAVMLPRPRYFEKTPNSAYLRGRSQKIVERMSAVTLPED